MKNSQHDKLLVKNLEAKLEQAKLVRQNLQIRMAEIEAEITEIFAALCAAKGRNDDDLTFVWDDEI